MKIFQLIILLIFISSSSSAQDYVDLIKNHYAISPANSFDSIGGKTDVVEFGTDITLPIVLKNENVFITGIAAEQINLKLDPLTKSYNLSSIALKLGYQANHSNKVSGTYMLLPKLASDFKRIGGKDFQLGGLALYKIKKSELFKYHAGLYYNKELFGPFVVPLLGFYYKSDNKKFEANFTLPIWADVNYSLTNWMNIGTNFSAIVRSYHLSQYNTYIAKKTNEIFGYLQFNIKKSFILQTKVGYSIGRSYKAYADDDKTDFGFSAFRFGDNRTVLNPTFNDGIIFRVRLLYRFHIKEKS
ncbi:MAG: DUF6268 family outer membrane beta-barrel protein [Vicingaceae bacterium]|nr:DUF6268 family outer membrane beta-barrel protein [Vicingaceae bacterium]